ncbi:hypothetical protein [Phaeospirillum tilakii]|uniref:Uncharacterized protein n=1 Tax=Phaeospirillum tilakii TaxID=741673 RepID=A0ABW5CDE3_9PROT
MSDDTNDLVIGSIDVLRGLIVCVIESGIITHQSAINVMNTIIDIQKNRDCGNNPVRHIPAELLRETVEALLSAPASSRPSLRLILGGASEREEVSQGD